jgi:glycosyltransferase involved in cell wall biosynthesis
MAMSTTPLVSVVIPTYNHARYLNRALQSVLLQTSKCWEVIVIDNHSTDNTDEVIANFADSRIAYFKIHNNGVIAASRNAGIRLARGEWIAFLDADDWWMDCKLQACLDCVNDNVDLIYHDLKIVSDKVSIFRRKIVNSWQVKAPVLVDLLLRGNAITNSSVMVRKSLLVSIGGISENSELIAAEDYNTWLRISEITDQFLYISTTLGYYLEHSQGASKKDTTASQQFAVKEYLHLLSERQKTRRDASFRFTSGRFNAVLGNYARAAADFCFVIKHGHLTLKMRSIVLMLALSVKTCLRAAER